MEKILFISDTNSQGQLPKVSLEVLAGAKMLAEDLNCGPVLAGLLGGEVQAAADTLAGCGVSQVMAVAGADFSVSRYSTDTVALETIIVKFQPSLIICPATTRLARAVPGIAARVQGKVDTHVSGLAVEEGKPYINRWYYRQRMMATLSREQRPWFMLVDAGVFKPLEQAAGTASIELLDVSLAEDLKKTQVTGTQAPSTDAQTIRPDAKLLFVAGAGWTKKQSDGELHLKDAEQRILTFLEKSQASLGSSKSLVDQSSEGESVLGFMSHLNQIGQTGATPRHPKGLATCCHGEEPHVVGWRFINDRRAINMDANCGWAQGKADVLYVANAFEVMEEVNKLLG